MSLRETYERKMKNQLQQLKAEIDELRKKADQTETNLELEYYTLGEKVRFDSGHKRNAYINGILSNFFEFTTFCPEVEIGLSIPREPIRLVTLNDEVRCIGTRNLDLDVTEDLYRSADEQQSWHRQLCGYILKKGSPSCGMERVRLYKGNIPDRIGVGLYAERLM